ncbi:hypothetical protein Acsp04_27870 [Actinomadura sp. NBRC 104425]|uniref:DUF3566 domain-containing protein n=1 Tax=Actinomadura sp. NBRC 104425 TaxID=3032204 RepID=UPI0024A26629|nr:DUF3566 domain-containing protein [Actinomadura sp. NBRC 104425]GLZ12552.1 hypothetical protein Acsp04_27870 [Actinomadura sp. NBRC 104425]
MSTQPGKSKGKASGSSPGSSSGSSSASGGGKKTSAASARPDRDEAKVNIPDTPVSDETRPDLRATKDDTKIAPVTDDTTVDGWGKPAAEPGGPKTDQPAGRPAGSGFTGTAVKDRQGPGTGPAATPVAGAGATPGAPQGAAPAAPGAPGAPQAGAPAAPAASAPSASGRPTRKAQLQLARLEPWSVMKFSFMMSLVCFIVLLVAVVVLYVILSGLGVFSAISDTVNDLTRQQGETSGGLDAGSWFSFARIFTYTLLVGALNVLLVTALSTVGSVIYNLVADLVGGVEVTLKEAE